MNKSKMQQHLLEHWRYCGGPIRIVALDPDHTAVFYPHAHDSFVVNQLDLQVLKFVSTCNNEFSVEQVTSCVRGEFDFIDQSQLEEYVGEVLCQLETLGLVCRT